MDNPRPGEQSDFELVQAFNSGDIRGFDRLFERYAGRLVRYLSSLTGDRELSFDLAQDVFIKLFNNLSNFQEKNFSAWIFTIARRTVIDAYRKRNLRTVALGERQPGEDSPEISTLKPLFDDSGLPYLANLGALQREVLLLRVVEGLSYREVAKITGCTEVQARKIFSRTLQKLREGLTADGLSSSSGMD